MIYYRKTLYGSGPKLTAVQYDFGQIETKSKEKMKSKTSSKITKKVQK